MNSLIQAEPVSPNTISTCAKFLGLDFTDVECELMAERWSHSQEAISQIRALSLDNSVPLSLTPNLIQMGGMTAQSSTPATREPIALSAQSDVTRPADLEEVAFYPVTQLAALIRSRQVTSLELTQMYLTRLKRYNPTLNCVVNLTEERALAQAQQMDDELASGTYRGPLHGIPWGAKDLLATKGTLTTWGSGPFKEQMIDMNATVVERLDAAGAVLVAKLTMGELARGDQWFGGQTKNPWDTNEGSSGSSAGPGSATAAGLVGFSIGTETNGSIVSPSHRCGITGLRPSYGRVSRHGAMALSWSMDKIGPMCRSVEDCALVFDAIYGSDVHDPTVVNQPFRWEPTPTLDGTRIGYVKNLFEEDPHGHHAETLRVLTELGATLIPIELPEYPSDAMMGIILMVEAAAAFDELTRSNRDELLVDQSKGGWPNTLRCARLIPAVEYIQANRHRTVLIQAMAQLMADIDCYVHTYPGGSALALTNYTGHPVVLVPNGFADVSDVHKPVSSMMFTGRLFDEGRLLAVAKAYQDALPIMPHPPKFMTDPSAS